MEKACGQIALRRMSNALAGLHRVVRMIKDREQTNTDQRYDACVQYMVLIQRQINSVIWMGGSPKRKKPGPYSKYCVSLSGFLVDCITALANQRYPDKRDAEAEVWRIVCMR